jgi:hypothetical protein
MINGFIALLINMIQFSANWIRALNRTTKDLAKFIFKNGLKKTGDRLFRRKLQFQTIIMDLM